MWVARRTCALCPMAFGDGLLRGPVCEGLFEGRWNCKVIPIMNELVQMAQGPVPTGDGQVETDPCLSSLILTRRHQSQIFLFFASHLRVALGGIVFKAEQMQGAVQCQMGYFRLERAVVRCGLVAGAIH